jgi:hypothetical protein
MLAMPIIHLSREPPSRYFCIVFSSSESLTLHCQVLTSISFMRPSTVTGSFSGSHTISTAVKLLQAPHLKSWHFCQFPPRRASFPLFLMKEFAELMQRLLEIQSGGRQRSPELVAEDERLMDALQKRDPAGKPPPTGTGD